MIVGFILEMSFLENLSSCFRGFTDKGRPSIELIPNSTNDPPTYRASFSEAGSLGGQTRHQVLLSTLSTPSTSQRTIKAQFPDEIRHILMSQQCENLKILREIKFDKIMYIIFTNLICNFTGKFIDYQIVQTMMTSRGCDKRNSLLKWSGTGSLPLISSFTNEEYRRKYEVSQHFGLVLFFLINIKCLMQREGSRKRPLRFIRRFASLDDKDSTEVLLENKISN